MDIDSVLVVAQLLTGLATLTVASVLIWQMVLQRKSLEMAHRDNEPVSYTHLPLPTLYSV